MQARERRSAAPERSARPEDVAAKYAGRWVIYRDLCRDGTHDEWVAEPRYPGRGTPAKITADDIPSLADKLAAAES